MNDETKRRALALWEAGQAHHMRGGLEEAIALYDQSIALCPTAEAYTFRGWAYSFQGRIDDAIDECKKAIACDPTFGNPYNDIGSYLMRKGETAEAATWLERAKRAERYDPRHFPYMNLARLYASQGQLARAIEELTGALAIKPGEPTCVRMLEQLRHALN